MRAMIPASIVLLSLACTTRLGEFAVVSRRAAIEQPAPAPAVSQSVKGRSCRKMLLLFIPLGPKADLSDAFDAALASAPGATALVDVTVRRETLITVVYDEHCFVVEGKAVTFRPAAREAAR